MISVVDLFAGPGGLGEGFSAYRPRDRGSRFQITVSIEKDPLAFATLRLRALRRCLTGRVPAPYSAFLRGEIDWDTLANALPCAASVANSEAHCIELGRTSDLLVKDLIADRVPSNENWVLIGGPPCQAYSIVGRSRNRGIIGYRPEADLRQTLYIEYLQILADHAPPVFVMENVKGLLSARLHRSRLFERIMEDLRDPATALRREARRPGTRKPRYEIRALAPQANLFMDAAENFVIKAEDFGIPQSRHRVILVGVRSDLDAAKLRTLTPHSERATVQATLENLPRLRSGISRAADSAVDWVEAIRGFRRGGWISDLAPDVRHQVLSTLENVRAPMADRGADYTDRGGATVLNHSARSHMVGDLERYLFASSYARALKASPRLSDFPKTLLPKHENVRETVNETVFDDRFRVQVANKPSTTITSHISKDGHYYIHHDPTQCRSLTVREAARLQTFPDDYFFCGPRTAQYQQVGNAVPPKLARQIAAVIAPLLE